jgi:hypothetical protein
MTLIGVCMSLIALRPLTAVDFIAIEVEGCGHTHTHTVCSNQHYYNSSLSASPPSRPPRSRPRGDWKGPGTEEESVAKLERQ